MTSYVLFACSVHKLAHSLWSLPWMVVISEYVVNTFSGNNRICCYHQRHRRGHFSDNLGTCYNEEWERTVPPCPCEIETRRNNNSKPPETSME